VNVKIIEIIKDKKKDDHPHPKI